MFLPVYVMLSGFFLGTWAAFELRHLGKVLPGKPGRLDFHKQIWKGQSRPQLHKLT